MFKKDKNSLSLSLSRHNLPLVNREHSRRCRHPEKACIEMRSTLVIFYLCIAFAAMFLVPATVEGCCGGAGLAGLAGLKG